MGISEKSGWSFYGACEKKNVKILWVGKCPVLVFQMGLEQKILCTRGVGAFVKLKKGQMHYFAQACQPPTQKIFRESVTEGFGLDGTDSEKSEILPS